MADSVGTVPEASGLGWHTEMSQRLIPCLCCCKGVGSIHERMCAIDSLLAVWRALRAHRAEITSSVRLGVLDDFLAVR